MNVLALTIFVGLLLVSFFVILWIASISDPRQFNERDALLPLEPDGFLVVDHSARSPLDGQSNPSSRTKS